MPRWKGLLMKVWIESLNVEHQLKTKGMQLDIYSPDGETRLGDLTVTKTKLIWCKGKKHKKNGSEATWEEFIAWMEGRE